MRRGPRGLPSLIDFYLTAGVVKAAVGLARGSDPELDHASEMAACVRLVAGRSKPARSPLVDDHVDLWSLGGGA